MSNFDKRRRLTRGFSFLVILILAIALAACGRSNRKEEPTPTLVPALEEATATPEPEPTPEPEAEEAEAEGGEGTEEATGEEATAEESAEVIDASVYFVSPSDGDTVSTSIDVVMGADGLTIEPSGEINEGAGHMHILVDTDFIEPGEVIPNDETHLHYGDASVETTIELTPGEHVLRLQFADGAHIALEGDQYRDEITIIVEESEAAEGDADAASEEGDAADEDAGAAEGEEATAEGEAENAEGEAADEDAGETHAEDEDADEAHADDSDGDAEAADAEAADAEAEEVAPRVYFAQPANNAVIPPTSTAIMMAEGLTIEPSGEINEGAGHMHILVDTDFIEPGEVIPNDETHLHYGDGSLETTLELEPGEHVLRLQFADGAHIALDGDQYRHEINVTVAEDAAEEAVYFVSPADGDSVGTSVEVVMSATGLIVEPAGEIREGAGHMHILVDADFIAPGEVIPNDEQHLHFGDGSLETTLELEPGEHILRLQFADGAHIALDGEQYQDEITITVAE